MYTFSLYLSMSLSKNLSNGRMRALSAGIFRASILSVPFRYPSGVLPACKLLCIIIQWMWKSYYPSGILPITQATSNLIENFACSMLSASACAVSHFVLCADALLHPKNKAAAQVLIIIIICQFTV